MSWHEHHCWSLSCDVCGDGWDELEGDPHFGSRDDAQLHAKEAGWVLTARRAVCPDCTLAEACALTGHEWGPWSKAGPFPSSIGGTWSGRVRHCTVCSAADWDPPVSR